MSDASYSQLKTKSQKPKADLGGPTRVVLSAFGIFLASQFFAALLIGIGLNFIGAQQNIDQSAAAQFVYILFVESLVIAGIYWLLKRRGIGLPAIGIGRRLAWRDFKWAVAGFFAFYGLVVAVTLVITLLIPSFDVDQAQDVGFNYLSTPLDQIIALVALVALPSIGEEILMRGYLYSGLRLRLTFFPALVITSLLFGAAHLSTGVEGALWAAGVSTFILSVVLVFLRERTGALYAPIMLHVFNNLVAFFAHFHS